MTQISGQQEGERQKKIIDSRQTERADEGVGPGAHPSM